MNAITNAVEKNRKLILDTERYIWANPETGYKEYKTDKYMADTFKALGYDIVHADGITGFYTVIDTGREGPEVLVLGELDSVICPSHPDADKTTGAVHACGHNAQCAALVGIAAALREPDVLAKLCGRIRLCAVPAEELLEIEFRRGLRSEGKIKYMGGKTEFLSRGYFDGVDLALMIHTGGSYYAYEGAVGCVAKKISFNGVSAHAGGAPWEGKNALYAANCGLNAINAIRETFKEPDMIRVHPIITRGGDIVNAIPECVTLESYVRGTNFEGIVNANKSVNRALVGAALSLGTNVDITDIPGYSPLNNAKGMIDLCEDAFRAIFPDKEFTRYRGFESGSTDMGDLSMVMPVVHPYCAGRTGKSHGADYQITAPEEACINSAKWQLTMVTMLLENGAARAKDILANFTPTFASKAEFLSYLDSLNRSGERITYDGDTAKIEL